MGVHGATPCGLPCGVTIRRMVRLNRPREYTCGAASGGERVSQALGVPITIAQLTELVVRDTTLGQAVLASVARSAALPWSSRIPRPGSAPKSAPGRAEPAPRPSGPGAVERAPERTAGAAQGMPVAVAPAAPAATAPTSGSPGAAAAPAAPAARRGVFGRKSSAAPAVAAAAVGAPVRAAGELERELQAALRQRGAR